MAFLARSSIFSSQDGSRQWEVDSHPRLVDGSIQIFPAAFDFHVGLVQSPAGPDCPFTRPTSALLQRGISHDPAIQRRMVYFDVPYFHDFFELPKTNGICHISANSPQNHLTFAMDALELDHRDFLRYLAPGTILQRRCNQKFMTEPVNLSAPHQSSHPVLRRPAATPLIEMRMVRRVRSSCIPLRHLRMSSTWR